MYASLLPLAARRVLRSQGFGNFHPWLADFQGRAMFREMSPWDRALGFRMAMSVVRIAHPFGFHSRWFLHIRRFGEDADYQVPVLNANALTTGTVSTTLTSDATWNNVSNVVECIGGGAPGAHGASSSTGGGGGGGGAYNRITGFSFATPGTTQFHYTVGAAGLAAGSFPINGGDSWFGPTTQNTFPTSGTGVGAHGGRSPATNTTATGGVGAATTNGFPTTTPPARAGGTAANGVSASAGGGGGGAGGPNGVGGNGSGTTGGTADGGLVTGGSPGNPGTNNSGTEWTPTIGCGSGGGGSNASGGTGAAGGSYGGGGGGGSNTTGTGGNGAGGLVVLTWAVESAGWQILGLTRNLGRTRFGHI